MPDVVGNISAANLKVVEKLNYLYHELPDTSDSPIATTNDAVGISQGLLGSFSDALYASQGNVGKTTFYVQASSVTGEPAEIACLEDGLLFINDVFIKAMVAQETYAFTAIIGDKLEMIGGGLNAVNQAEDPNAPVEVNNTANAAKEFFWNRFRETNGNEYTTATLPVETNIKVYGPNPTFVNGVITGTPQHDINIAAGATVKYVTNGVGEYYLIASQPVIHTSMNIHSTGVADPRAINPPVRVLIGHTRSGGGNNLSSLRENNTVNIYQRSGEIGTFIASPGSPAKIDVGIGGGEDFAPGDIGIAYAQGEICAYAGADSGGRNATQWQDVNSASNNFVLTLDVDVAGNGDDRGVLFGAYECEWFIYNPDGSYLGSLDMRRANAGTSASPATTKEHQLHPAAVNFQPNSGIFAGLNPIPAGTRFVSNMPAFVIANYDQTDGDWATEDETTVFGTILPSRLCQTRTRQNRLLERLVLDEATGVETWEPA